LQCHPYRRREAAGGGPVTGVCRGGALRPICTYRDRLGVVHGVRTGPTGAGGAGCSGLPLRLPAAGAGAVWQVACGALLFKEMRQRSRGRREEPQSRPEERRGRRPWRLAVSTPVALEDHPDGVAVWLSASARVCFDVGVVEVSTWSMRATCAAVAGGVAWPGGPATGSQPCAWARRSGPGVGRSANGGAGPPRSLRGAVHRSPGRPRALERECARQGSSFNFVYPFSKLQNFKNRQLS
jgi:hypothetical protein